MKFLDDVLIFVGCAVVVVGIGLIYIPAAVIAAGIILVILGVVVGIGNQTPKEDK